ncbi:unnamed protein product [Cunninghamella echinulata]
MTLTSPTYRNGPFYPTSINNHKIPQPTPTKSSSHEYTMLFLLPELVHDEEEEEEEEEEDSSITLASPPSTPPLSSSLSIKRSSSSSSSSSTSTSSSFNSSTMTKNNADNSLRKRQKCIPRPSPYASSSDRVFQLPSISSLPSPPSPSLSTSSHHHLQYIIRGQQLQQQQREKEEEKEKDQPLIIYLNHHHHHHHHRSPSSQYNQHNPSFSSSSSVTSTTTSPTSSPTSYLLKAMNESISSPSLTTIPPPSTTIANNNDHFTIATPLPRLPSSSSTFSIHPHDHHNDNDNKERNPILMTTLPMAYNNDNNHSKKKNKTKSLLLSKPIKLNENNNKKNNTNNNNNNNKPFTTSSIYSINGIKQEKPPHSTVFSSGRPVRTKGPCQACRESTEACMRKAFDWPFPSDEIYYDKGKPFVYLCNKCGLRYNKSGGSVCRKCRWVLCKEEKRKALQYIEDIRALRPDGKIDLDEDIPSFICTPKYWHCGQPWKVNWILNLPTSSSSSSSTPSPTTIRNNTISTITCDTTS